MQQPNLYSIPGSLTLKSNLPMEYSRPTLSNKWHVKYESQPQDFPLWSGNKPSLHQSTYSILGKQLDHSRCQNETEASSSQKEVFDLVNEFRDKPTPKKMVDLENSERVGANLLRSSSSSYPVLPKHTSDQKKQYHQTTYGYDYKYYDPSFQNRIPKEKPQVENAFAYRRMISQFTDIDAPKREGINLFHIQHGVYPNQNLKDILRN